ncbi:MAG: SGNH/GDSL hydrolase family protein [Verrucomicrobiae bacterium]|nr:SGNH/GDSL hydrolase family protein [Verrucomicrobiae bacterium]
MRFKVWLGLVLFALIASLPSARGGFSSMFVFGDGTCATTNNQFAGPYYYGLRRSNGRVWVEVLAQWQGIPFDSNKNWSYFGHDSTNLVANATAFTPPPDVATTLFVIWCINADLVWLSNWGGTDMPTWTNALNQALRNHYRAVTNLYAKGARTLLMPNAADVTITPFYSYYPDAWRVFARQRIVELNQKFAQMLAELTNACPGLRIYMPDFFWVGDHILTNAAAFGLTNVLDENGKRIDALADSRLKDKSLNGPGANYIFWDMYHPTARTHMVLAEYAQRLLSPLRFGQISTANRSNRIELVNLPVGRGGFIDASPDLQTWSPLEVLIPTNTTQTVLLPQTGAAAFYRLRFPFNWTWP